MLSLATNSVTIFKVMLCRFIDGVYDFVFKETINFILPCEISYLTLCIVFVFSHNLYAARSNRTYVIRELADSTTTALLGNLKKFGFNILSSGVTADDVFISILIM